MNVSSAAIARSLKLGQKVEVEFQAAGDGSTAREEVQRRPHGSPAVSRRARPPGAGVIETFFCKVRGPREASYSERPLSFLGVSPRVKPT